MQAARILLLGATGGVGKAVAAALKTRGALVVASCRHEEQGKALIAEGLADQAITLSLDRQESIEQAFGELAERGIIRLSGIVNCAALTWPRPLELTALDDVRYCFETNVFGPLRLIQLALPLLRKGNGRIVLVSSTSGSLGVPLLGTYSASKFALEALADVLRRELSEWKLPVSLVIPGGIDTPMIASQYKAIDSAIGELKTPLQKVYVRQYQQHRNLIALAEKAAVTPEQVADDVIAALFSRKPKARYLCGMVAKGTRPLSHYLPDSWQDTLFDLIPSNKK